MSKRTSTAQINKMLLDICETSLMLVTPTLASLTCRVCPMFGLALIIREHRLSLLLGNLIVTLHVGGDE